jgi:transketolase
LYPSDATSTASLVAEMAERSGVVYMCTTRGAYPVLYGPDEVFPIGGAEVLRSSPDDHVTLAGAGRLSALRGYRKRKGNDHEVLQPAA